MLTEGNIKRLVSKLTQMRGAALKLGQFMSIPGLCPHIRVYDTVLTYDCKTAMSFHQR